MGLFLCVLHGDIGGFIDTEMLEFVEDLFIHYSVFLFLSD